MSGIYNAGYQRQYREKNRAYFSNYRRENKEYFRLKIKKWKADNPVKFKKLQDDWQSKNVERIRANANKVNRRMARRYKFLIVSAAKRKHFCNLSFESYSKLAEQPCFYCGVSLAFMMGSGLDRVRNDLGYIPSNVVPCCGPCNRMKSNVLTFEEMQVAMKAVIEHRGKRGNGG